MIPERLRFLDTHEWARLENNVVVAGLSAHAIEQLGDIVFVELPAVGAAVTKGASFGVIESVKAASDMYAPVSGKVIEVNGNIPDSPDTLKADAYGNGWLIKIRVENRNEFDGLMDAAAYEEFIKHQSH